jgi:conjugal transfer mating pair stabilization protein TraG
VIGEAQSDPTFAKLIANAYDQEQMIANDLTSAQIQVGAMEGRRDFAGESVAGIERGNVATEQALRTGSNQGPARRRANARPSSTRDRAPHRLRQRAIR